MTKVSRVKPEPLNLVISCVAGELVHLLSKVQDEARQTRDRGGVLTVAVDALPGLAANMATDMYVKQGLVPKVYTPVAPLSAGWRNVLEIVAQNAIRRGPLETAQELAYNEGSRWASARIMESCPALGADTGAEPLTCEIARKALELDSLLAQVNMPGDESPGGGVLALAKFAMPALVRNMNEGLYLAFGLIPRVENPAYLPPRNWKGLLEEIRLPAVTALENEKDKVKYQYHEGVRWTCAKFRDAFQHLSEPAQYA
jgi:hypothetical protein